MPCVSALRPTRALPAAVFGPRRWSGADCPALRPGTTSKSSTRRAATGAASRSGFASIVRLETSGAGRCRAAAETARSWVSPDSGIREASAAPCGAFASEGGLSGLVLSECLRRSWGSLLCLSFPSQHPTPVHTKNRPGQEVVRKELLLLSYEVCDGAD